MIEDTLEYFVVFNWQTNIKKGIGNQAVLVNKKFSTLEHIREIEKVLLRENPDWISVVVTNFIPFS